MTDYTELVKALRSASTVSIAWGKLMIDAADAIEDLQAMYRQMDKRNTDLHNDGYDVGYWAGKRDAEAAQPHWVSVEQPPKGNGAFAACCVYDGKIYWFKAIYLDGKWLREMDGVELPVNYWMEIPQPPQEVQDGANR